MKTDLSKDIQLLKQHYQNCRQHVSDSHFYSLYADEKIHHSLQVLGAGNYILKHESSFNNRDSEFIRKARLAYLLHDIGRFEEIRRKYDDYKNSNTSKKYDHSLLGADILRNIPEYNHPLIVIPVKHHGHLIEELYEDKEYTSIKDEQLKEDIKKVIFLVRDADKTANFNLIKIDKNHFSELFFDTKTSQEKEKTVSTDLFCQFQNCQTINKHMTKTATDNILCFIAWIFDINYKAAFDFTCRAGGVDFLIEQLGEYTKNKELQQTVAKTVKNYITLRYNNFKELL